MNLNMGKATPLDFIDNVAVAKQCGAPVKSRTLSWGSHKSNFTMVYDTQITIVFLFYGVYVHQRSHHWGHHATSVIPMRCHSKRQGYLPFGSIYWIWFKKGLGVIPTFMLEP